MKKIAVILFLLFVFLGASCATFPEQACSPVFFDGVAVENGQVFAHVSSTAEVDWYMLTEGAWVAANSHPTTYYSSVGLAEVDNLGVAWFGGKEFPQCL